MFIVESFKSNRQKPVSRELPLNLYSFNSHFSVPAIYLALL